MAESLLLQLPDVPFDCIVRCLTLRDEAALVQTCKEAQQRCRGQLRSVKRLFAKLSDVDKLASVRLFATDCIRRIKRHRWGLDEDRFEQVKQALKEEDSDSQGCDDGGCNEPGTYALAGEGFSMCHDHIDEHICRLCGATEVGDLLECEICRVDMCGKCADLTVHIGKWKQCYLCGPCTGRVTIREFLAHHGAEQRFKFVKDPAL